MASVGVGIGAGAAPANRWGWTGRLLPLLGVLITLGLWWAATAYLVPSGSVLAKFAPQPTLEALERLLGQGTIWPHLLASVRRIVVGLTLSMLIGVPLGLMMGGIGRFASTWGVVFQFLRVISPLAWAPLAVMLFGIGDAPVYFLITMGCVWPITLNVAAGVHALNPRWVVLARSLGATRSEVFRSIVWPGVRQHVLTGFRLSVGLAWVILVPAEMLGVDSGLGYAVLNTRDRLAYGELMAMILVIGACGYIMDVLVNWLVSGPLSHGVSLTIARPRRATADTPAGLVGAPVEAASR